MESRFNAREPKSPEGVWSQDLVVPRREQTGSSSLVGRGVDFAELRRLVTMEQVLELLEWTLERTGPVPVLLERDNAVPALGELLSELVEIRTIYDRAVARHAQKEARASA